MSSKNNIKMAMESYIGKVEEIKKQKRNETIKIIENIIQETESRFGSSLNTNF